MTLVEFLEARGYQINDEQSAEYFLDVLIDKDKKPSLGENWDGSWRGEGYKFLPAWINPSSDPKIGLVSFKNPPASD